MDTDVPKCNLGTREEARTATIIMGFPKLKTEGGSGGKRGHSNMAHWIATEEIKAATRKRRRTEAKQITHKARLVVDCDL